jgi:hypothetical protein
LQGNTLGSLHAMVGLEIRNSAGAVENLDLLRDPASGVQGALTTFGVTQPPDADTLYSLGGVFDAAIFIFYRNAVPCLPGPERELPDGSELFSDKPDVCRITLLIDNPPRHVLIEQSSRRGYGLPCASPSGIDPGLLSYQMSITATILCLRSTMIIWSPTTKYMCPRHWG